MQPYLLTFPKALSIKRELSIFHDESLIHTDNCCLSRKNFQPLKGMMVGTAVTFGKEKFLSTGLSGKDLD